MKTHLSCGHKNACLYFTLGDEYELFLCPPCGLLMIAHSLNNYNHFPKEFKDVVHRIIKEKAITVIPTVMEDGK